MKKGLPSRCLSETERLNAYSMRCFIRVNSDCLSYDGRLSLVILLNLYAYRF